MPNKVQNRHTSGEGQSSPDSSHATRVAWRQKNASTSFLRAWRAILESTLKRQTSKPAVGTGAVGKAVRLVANANMLVHTGAKPWSAAGLATIREPAKPRRNWSIITFRTHRR